MYTHVVEVKPTVEPIYSENGLVLVYDSDGVLVRLPATGACTAMTVKGRPCQNSFTPDQWWTANIPMEWLDVPAQTRQQRCPVHVQ